MTLRGFHIVFITIATLFLFWMASFAYQVWKQENNGTELCVAVISGIAGVALAVYGVWFIRKGRYQTIAHR